AVDVIQEVKAIDLRGQYFVCEAPPNLAVFDNDEEHAENQFHPPSHQQYPSI
ncbi:unnamed protein product, partial [Symbiodinium pilosum]